MGRLPGPLRGSHPTALDPGQPRLQLLLAPTRPTTHPAPDTAPLSGTRARTPVLGATAATDPLLPDPASGPGPTRTDRCPQTEHPRNHPAIHHSRRRDRPEPLPAPIGRGTETRTDHNRPPVIRVASRSWAWMYAASSSWYEEGRSCPPEVTAARSR